MNMTAMIPRDYWIEPAQRVTIIQFARQYSSRSISSNRRDPCRIEFSPSV
jgi:hypothetical protein